jgi:hypothetical protein
MLDEWKEDDGIQVLDGWSFQASGLLFYFIQRLM